MHPMQHSKIQDLYHVMVECPKFNDTRQNDLKNLINIDRAEFYWYLHSLNKKDSSIAVKFMDRIEETIRQKY